MLAFFFLLASGYGVLAVEPDSAEAKMVSLKAEPFDLRDVQLLESRFKDAQDINRQLLVEMEFDLLVHPFREIAGISTPVKGSAAPHYHYAYTGHTAGHYLSACALHYRNTGDEEVRKKADAVVAEMASCQEKIGTGYLGGFPEEKMGGVPWYCLHKIYAGLLDMYVLAENEQARDVLMKITDWADRYTGKMTDTEMQGMLRTEHGGICEFWGNLYAATGDERCLNLAERFVQQDAVGPFARGEDWLAKSHANTQVPKFSSVARLYQLTGNRTNLASAVNFWRSVTADWSYVTGGNSYAEYFQKQIPFYIGARNTESCNQYNMLKLVRYLFNVEPMAAYTDYYERTLYNHILSTKNLQTGGQSYFQPLQSGNIKGDAKVFTPVMGWRFLFERTGPDARYDGSASSCCSGSGLESNAKYADSIYFHHADSDLYVNLFIPSVLNWKAVGLTVKQETRYPEEDITRLVFECEKSVALKLHFRRPWWATRDFRVLVNGQKQDITVSPGSYAMVERTWQNGDRVEVKMPMSFRMEGFKDDPNMAAVMYGPLVMAAETEYGNPFSVVESADNRFLETLKPVEGKPLEFTGPASIFRTSPVAVGDRPVVFRPLYKTFDNPYAIYWQVMTPDAFKAEAAMVEAELARQKELEPRTADMVLFESWGDESFTFQSQLLSQPGWLARDPESVTESAHKVKTHFGHRRNIAWETSAMFFGYKGKFLLLEHSSWTTFQMKVLPDRDQAVEVMLWKSPYNKDNVMLKQGTLEVMVEGKHLGSCDAAAIPAGQFTRFSFNIPADLIKEKEQIELKLNVPEKSEAVHGIYECRIVVADVSSSQLISNLIAGKPQTIVTYGTSLTAGGAWVGQMKEALNNKYKSLITVINSGACSMWSKWGVDNLDALVIQKKPDTVFIEFAMNDAFLTYKTSVAAARTNLLNMIDRIQAAKADTEIILMTMNPPIGVHLERRPKIADYVQMYRDVAKERSLRLLDNYPNWERILQADAQLYTKYVPDGIHPGAEGYRNVVTPVILKSLGLAPSGKEDARFTVMSSGIPIGTPRRELPFDQTHSGGRSVLSRVRPADGRVSRQEMGACAALRGGCWQRCEGQSL